MNNWKLTSTAYGDYSADYESYRSLQEYYTDLESLVQGNQHLLRVTEQYESKQGRPLYVVKCTNSLRMLTDKRTPKSMCHT